MKSIQRLINKRAELKKERTKKRTPKTAFPDVIDKKENNTIKKVKKNQINSNCIKKIKKHKKNQKKLIVFCRKITTNFTTED